MFLLFFYVSSHGKISLGILCTRQIMVEMKQIFCLCGCVVNTEHISSILSLYDTEKFFTLSLEGPCLNEKAALSSTIHFLLLIRRWVAVT